VATAEILQQREDALGAAGDGVEPQSAV